jgi:hypothetical protein
MACAPMENRISAWFIATVRLTAMRVYRLT